MSSAFFTSGEVPGFTGEATGEAVGLAVATGTGVATGLFGTSVFGSQAPNTVTLAARTVDNINDLLIVFLPLICDADENCPLNRHPQPDDAMRLSANDRALAAIICRKTSTLRVIERAARENLQEIISR